MKKFFGYHFPAILYGILIILFSSIPQGSLPKLGILLADKIVHFIEYGLFSVLVFRSFSCLFVNLRFSYVFWSTFLFIMLFALLDEFYQGYVPGRNSDLWDILFDMLGAILILLFLWLRKKKQQEQ